MCPPLYVFTCWVFTLLEHLLPSFPPPLWSFYILFLLLCPERWRGNFPETDGGWRSPDLISRVRAVLCALYPQPQPPSLCPHVPLSWQFTTIRPQTINPRNHRIKGVHTFSAWLGPVGLKPQKPWQCLWRRAVEDTQHMTISRTWSSACTGCRKGMLIVKHVEKRIETNCL